MANKFGMKWSELLIPGALGLLGSWNRDTGRGVSLGIDAYNVLKKHQKDPAEEKASKRLSEHYAQRAEELRTQQATRARGRALEDVRETGQYGYFQEQGPQLPSPKPEVERDMARVTDVLGIGLTPDDVGTMAVRQGGGLQQLPQQTGFQRGLESAVPQLKEEGPDFEAMNQAIEQRTQEMIPGMDNTDIRFNEIMSELAAVNPASAGYLGGQQVAQESASRRELERIYEQEKSYARGRQQQAAIDMKIHNMRYMADVDLIQERARYAERYAPITNSLGSFLVDKRKGTVLPINAPPGTSANSYLDYMDPNEVFTQYRLYNALLQKWLADGDTTTELDPTFLAIKKMNDVLYRYLAVRMPQALINAEALNPEDAAAQQEYQSLLGELGLGQLPPVVTQ